MTDQQYKVVWAQHARVALAKMKKFRIDSNKVFRRSKTILSKNPVEESCGISDFPGFDFNGYYWVLIHNVVVVYAISNNEVQVDACFFANSGKSAQIFWGIEPEDE